MTQKELAYVEDAIGHEENIIKILNNLINDVESDEISSFLENEINIHASNKEKLMNLLEVKTNE